MSKNLGTSFQAVPGNEALVVSQGKIMTSSLELLTSTATVCSAEELDIKSIGCLITFKDMDTWGFDEAICAPESCVDQKVQIFGGPVYSPGSSVCLAAEQNQQFKDIHGFKQIKVSQT